MIRFIKLHIGLFLFIKRELPKKKTFKEIISFLKMVVKSYFKELLRMFLSLFSIFNKKYRKQRRDYKNYVRIKKDLNRCIKMLQYIDKKMQKAGLTRQKRRQFWRDFYSSGEVRKEIFEDLLKEINQIK